MKTIKKKRRVQIIALAAVALTISAALIGYGFRDGISLYRSPSEVVAEPPRADEYFQLGGLVKEGSLVTGEGQAFDFVISDGANEVQVAYLGAEPAPDLFEEGQGTIAKGYYRNARFEAVELLAKHDETYMPKEVIQTLKETGVYQEPES